ncbi:unnamed protein product [Orchesella dallaii]|uniref:THAP-type domain-containing protein n=1 Tax=Orchesella dallaii TaxID=48710 RepID=A0ABP1R9T4_9HEXA
MGLDSCSVISCGKRSNSSEGRKLHYPPKDVFVAGLYLNFLKRSNLNYPSWKPAKRLCICSDHFDADAFVINEKDNQKRLKFGKYPTLLAGKDINLEIGPFTGMEPRSPTTKAPTTATGLPFEPPSMSRPTTNPTVSKMVLNRESPLGRPAFQIKKDGYGCDELLKQRIRKLESHVKILLEERSAIKVQSTNNKIEIDALRKKVESQLSQAAKRNHVLRQQNKRIMVRYKGATDEVDRLTRVVKRKRLTRNAKTPTYASSSYSYF